MYNEYTVIEKFEGKKWFYYTIIKKIYLIYL